MAEKTLTKRGKASGQLTRLDWLRAGEDILREKGIVHLKLAALTDRLRVSTGSFYHHFRDFDDFMAQLAAQFDGAEIKRAMKEASKDGAGPITRLGNLMNIAMQGNLYSLDAAMRDWAVTDKRAKAALDRARKMILSFYTDAFRDMGFDAGEAALRGRMLFAIKITYADKAHADRKFHKLALDVLIKGADKKRLT
jgi:AcrR family transcriptional regulator